MVVTQDPLCAAPHGPGRSREAGVWALPSGSLPAAGGRGYHRLLSCGVKVWVGVRRTVQPGHLDPQQGVAVRMTRAQPAFLRSCPSGSERTWWDTEPFGQKNSGSQSPTLRGGLLVLGDEGPHDCHRGGVRCASLGNI